MKLSFQWISDYVDLHDLTPETLADKLTGAGLEVEAITPRNQGVSGVVVGEVVACEPHPNADRLRVCQVNVGDGALRTIVCGAPNVAVGQKVPTALPGAKLPGGSIGVAKLRGIESHGMLCSAKEIGLETKLLPKEQTEGLYVLPPTLLLALTSWSTSAWTMWCSKLVSHRTAATACPYAALPMKLQPC